jgi:VWFA-related protein
MKPAAIVLAVSWVMLARVMPAGGPQQPTFRVNIDLVSVDVLVTRGGRPVPGLTATDFQVRDNGVLQHIDTVSEGALQANHSIRVQPVPLDVILVFDTSESMAGEKLGYLVGAARGVLDRLRPIDHAAILTFSDRTVLHSPLSPDLRTVGSALDRLDAEGRTSMFDAVYAALTLRRPGTSRTMLLLFSDGRDNASWLGARDVLHVARESDVVIYGVGLDPGVKDQVKDLVEETGGDLAVANSPKQLSTLFLHALDEMQARYVLDYYPKGVRREGWHAIEVRLVGRKAEIKARRGYYVPDR